ncbi:MAG: biotin--[acetyl-CoA-carboxylase] ligase [Gammaproteobacteria bacterium]|nr:MAG: biotin--[acetyl-CoA-carboxylase] ligase [Gammaproteobacteria bacterium]
MNIAHSIEVKLIDSSSITDRLNWLHICAHSSNGMRNIRHHEIHASITSTNDLALQQCSREQALPAVYLAESQSAGRGRRGKNWYSPQSRNIYMSLAWEMPGGIQALGGVAIAMGLAVARCLQHYGIVVGLKWPNDVLVGRRKIAGILIESKVRADGSIVIVTGIGVNYAMKQDFRAEDVIQQAWTDFVSEYPGREVVTRNELVASLLDNLLIVCEQYSEQGLAVFIHEWQKLDICLGQEVDVIEDGMIRSGIMKGIAPDGSIRVLHGQVEKRYYSAQVSLRSRN